MMLAGHALQSALPFFFFFVDIFSSLGQQVLVVSFTSHLFLRIDAIMFIASF